MKAHPLIQTKRLKLRPFVLEDASKVQELAGSEDVSSTTQYIPYPYPDGFAEGWIASLEPAFKEGSQIIWAIDQQGPLGLIGSIGIDISKEHQHASLGYWIGKPFWNQGFATEAARAVVVFCFKVLDLHRVQAKHLVRNPSSGRVMQKIGMSYEGTERESTKIRGAFETLANYAILKSDYLQLQKNKDTKA